MRDPLLVESQHGAAVESPSPTAEGRVVTAVDPEPADAFVQPAVDEPRLASADVQLPDDAASSSAPQSDDDEFESDSFGSDAMVEG